MRRRTALLAAAGAAALGVAAAVLASSGGPGDGSAGVAPAAAIVAPTRLARSSDPLPSVVANARRDPVRRATHRPVRARPPQFGTDNDEASLSASDPFDPCTLVTVRQARRILGARTTRQLGRQGPTCIYRARRAHRFVTVAVGATPVPAAARTARTTIRLSLAGRPAYCARRGDLALMVLLRDRRVLRIGAPCPIAARFAAPALARLARG